MPVTTRLYAFGSNGSGQLGLNHNEDLRQPEICYFAYDGPPDQDPNVTKTTTELEGLRIAKIVAGGNHTLVLTQSGDVYAAGDNSDGRCGLGDQLAGTDVFYCVGFSVVAGRVTDVAATWEASFFVVDRAEVYACGSGSKGELGIDDKTATMSSMTRVFAVAEHRDLVDRQVEISGISGSMSHVVLVLSSGEVYGWGGCRKGQLGDDFQGRKIIYKPTKLNVSFPIVQLALGRDYTFLLGANGDMRLFGDRKHFQQISQASFMPKDEIRSSWSSLYGLRGHALISMGRNDRGQLSPIDLPALTSFAPGSEHVIALTVAKKLIAWGWGEHGNCGAPVDSHGNVVSQYNTIELKSGKGEQAAGVAAGCATTFVWSEEDRSNISAEG